MEMTFRERLHDRWANFHPLFRFVIVLALLAVIAALVVKPGYRSFKAWRLEQNLDAAKVAVAGQRMDEARDLSLTVLRAGDPRIDAYRILEKSMASLRDPRHGDIARALLSHPEGSDDDRLNGFRGMVNEQPLGIVGQAWVALPEECRKRPEFAALFADRLIEEKRLGEASNVLLGVPENSTNDSVRRGLIRILIRSGSKDGFDEAQRRIASQWLLDSADRDAWLEVFEEIPVAALRPSLLTALRPTLGKSASSSSRSALALARLDYATDYSERAQLLDRVVAEWKDRDPCELARFLSGLGLSGMLVEHCPAAKVADAPGLLPFLLEALQRTGDWKQTGELLAAYESLMPRGEWLARRALVAAKSGDPATCAELWKSAIDEAGQSMDSGAYLVLHRIANEGGLEKESEQALVEAILRGRGPLPLYSDLKPLLESLAKEGRENVLLRICASYLLFEPSNPVLLTQYAYLACLNDLSEPDSILEALKPMADAFPDALPMQCVLATAYIDNGQYDKAAETMDKLKVKPEALAPGYRAVFLTTQVLNKRMAADDPAIIALPWKELLPSERKKFADWIKKGG